MRPNLITDLWKADTAVVNAWLSIPSSFSAEIMAHQGWDSLTIDLQHGLLDYQCAVQMLQAISTTNVVPLVRAPWLDPGIIMKLLDAGAYGVICPMIETASDTEKFVAACRYPPRGKRSCGPIRAALYGGADYLHAANDTVLTFAMIETLPALEQLDEILSVEGLDAVYVGPADLAFSLGRPPQLDPTDKVVLQAIDSIIKLATKRNVRAGIHTDSPEFAARMIAKGFRFVTVATDARILGARSSETMAEMRQRVPRSAG